MIAEAITVAAPNSTPEAAPPLAPEDEKAAFGRILRRREKERSGEPGGDDGPQSETDTATLLSPSKQRLAEPASMPGTLPPLRPMPVAQPDANALKANGKTADRDAGAPVEPAPARSPQATPALQPLHSPSHTAPIEPAAFRALMDRLEAGSPSSTRSDLHFPGEDWQVTRVVLDQQQSGLSVSIDLGARGEQSSATLDELRKRLDARGLKSDVIVR